MSVTITCRCLAAPRNQQRQASGIAVTQCLLVPRVLRQRVRQRPGAFAHAMPLRQWRETWPADYERLLTRFQTCHPEGRGVLIIRAVIGHPWRLQFLWPLSSFAVDGILWTDSLAGIMRKLQQQRAAITMSRSEGNGK